MPDRSPKWTVAVYLAGGDNVSREMVLSLHDIRDVALSKREDFKVLAQFEPDHKSPRLFAFDGAAREQIGAFRAARARSESSPQGLARYEYVMDETLPGSGGAAARLASFVHSARDYASGDPLMLVVSGHGNGAVGEFLGYRGEDPLFLLDLRDALAGDRRKVDVLGLDCCNMSMAEVAFELAPHARLMVASEGYILNHGWPYRPILEAIEGLDAESAALEAAREYADNYSDYGLLDVPSHCAVCRLDDVHLLAEPVRRLSERMIETLDDPDVWRPAVLAHWEAQSYKDEEYVDLADFCSRLRAHVGDPELQTACTEVMEAVAHVVPLNRISGSAFQYSTGLSVYFPWCHDVVKRSDRPGAPSDLERYGRLRFARETRWAELIDAYLVATRREPPPRRHDAATSPSHPHVHERLSMERKEMQMAIKRYPPWSSKGGPARTTSVKNHPREESGDGAALPVRRYPPWSSKGSATGRSTVKNHPAKR